VNTGDAVSFKVTGNLKIRDIVQPVTFDVTATARSDSEIEGTAKTTVTRSAFELTIPNVPSVADVTDDVTLELQFVATKA
jgi:polyisoprenoid-binding protein YceI